MGVEAVSLMRRALIFWRVSAAARLRRQMAMAGTRMALS
jgi:hypothetical protein